MRYCFLVALVSLVMISADAQHYYNDILSNQQSNANYVLLKQAKVSQVKGTSFEADESPTPNFKLQQELSRDKRKLITTTTNSGNVTTVTVSLFEGNRLKRTSDTLGTVANITEYSYDAEGRLTNIFTNSQDPDHGGNTTEEHRWIYKADGKPEKMLKVKNKADSVVVEFVYDDKNNLAEEHWKQRGKILESYYYYYNDQQQLTDVVRYNTRSKKLLPEMIFQYDNAGRVSQMLQTLQGTSTYLLWQYTYNEAGLKTKEVCYDKQRRMVGRIEYAYGK